MMAVGDPGAVVVRTRRLGRVTRPATFAT